MSKPFVSVLTPTYNRRHFIPQIIKCFLAQTYPRDKMEWIVLDDGTDKVGDLFKDVPCVRYIAVEGKMMIGAKRNRLNAEAKGEIMVCMDDDDYYPPERVSHAVIKLTGSPHQIAGSSELYMYYTTSGEIWRVGPYNPNHGTNGTLAYKRPYAKKHKYDETVAYAEEKSFLDGWKHSMVQLDSIKVMLVIAHTSNTFGKEGLRDRALARRAELTAKEERGEALTIEEKIEKGLIVKTAMKLNNFIRSAEMRAFYKLPVSASLAPPAPPIVLNV